MPSCPKLAAAAAAVCVCVGHGANPHPLLGPYQPVSNVVEHAQMVFDIEYFTDLVGSYSWADAKATYTDGRFSCKSTSMTRKFQDFVEQGTVDSKLRGTAFFDSFTNGTGPVAGEGEIPGDGRLALEDTFWDDFMLAALDRTGDFASASDDFRKVAAAKGILGVLTMYTAYEMESAIAKAGNGETLDTEAAHAWDEAWAFYYGSHPDAGKYSAWEFAFKRDRDYAYDDMGNRVSSAIEVSEDIVKYFNQGLRASRQATLDLPDLIDARNNIYRFLALTSIRAALKYAYLTFKDGYSETYHVEAYAYFLPAAGWVEQAAPGVASTVLDLLDYRKQESELDANLYCAVKQALVPAYAPLGLDCDLVGVYKMLPQSVTDSCSVVCPSAASVPSGLATYAEDTTTSAGSNVDCPVALPGPTAAPTPGVDASGAERAPSSRCAVSLAALLVLVLGRAL